MNYKIHDIEKSFDGKLVKSLGDGLYLIDIDGTEYELKIISISEQRIEFILDHTYHKVKYLEHATNEMNLVIDNTPITLGMHTHFDEIVYKNSGGGGANHIQIALKSQIPGKVVSLSVANGDTVKKGDVICTLESMKMQVAVKAHKDGVVSLLKIKETGTVAKGDVIAEIN